MLHHCVHLFYIPLCVVYLYSAVIAALETLKDKVHRLELEKEAAEISYRRLEKESKTFQDRISNNMANMEGSDAQLLSSLQRSLHATENRSQRLERELEVVPHII